MNNYIIKKLSDFFPVKNCDRYQVFIEYTDGTMSNTHYCLGWDLESAYEDMLFRGKAGYFNKIKRADGWTEFKTIKAYKLGSVKE